MEHRTFISRRALARLGLLAVALVVAACGSTAPSPSPTASGVPPASVVPSESLVGSPTPISDPTQVYSEIEAQVESIRGLSAKTRVDPKLLDDATLQANLAASFAKDNPAAEVAATERLYQLLGFLPAGTSLRDLELKLLGSQVAGYYDPDTKQLYVVSRSGALGPTQKVTFAHEFDHALQDQAFGLKNLHLDSIGEGDASLAHLSVAEGDATLLMTVWLQSNLSGTELVQLVKDANDPTQLAILAAMPPILRETLRFPYDAGLQMVMAAQASGGWKAVDALYARPPASTEQVLHADKYAANEAPVKIAFSADLAKRLGAGWSVAKQDTLGEYQLRLWLQSVGKVPVETATAAAAGWGGDRVVLVTKGGRAGVVIDTRWDSPKDATEFAAAAQTTLDALGGQHASIAIDGTDRVTLFVATDDAAINALASALGLAG